MMAAFLMSTLALPCVLALLLTYQPTRRLASASMPLAAAPALVLAFTGDAVWRLDGVLLGLHFYADAVSRPFLLLCGLAWSAAAWHMRRSLRESVFQFQLLWLLTLEALLLVLLAADAAGFYFGYVSMTLAIYGLVIHERSAEALRAGRIYLVMALAGEALILSGLLLLGARFGNFEFAALGALYGSDGAGLAGLCLFAGFAVKMGIVPLHMWLPLAHPVAPIPASAVLSGVLVKAGLIGWLRFLPPAAWAGEASMLWPWPVASSIDWPAGAPVAPLVALGLGTALYGVAMGLGQRRLKAVLAYSTISQMGLLLAGFAATIAHADARAATLPVLGLLVLHHGLNKAALFLAAGNHPGGSKLRMAVICAAALALAGAPFTSGAVVKSALSAVLGTPFAGAALLLSTSSIATALLMLRLLSLASRDVEPQRLAPAWIALAVLGLVVPWSWAVSHGLTATPSLGALLDASWPLLVAAGIAAVWRRHGRPLSVPEGDILAIVPRLGQTVPRSPEKPSLDEGRERVILRTALAGSERRLRTLPAAGLLLLGIAVLLWTLLD